MHLGILAKLGQRDSRRELAAANLRLWRPVLKVRVPWVNMFGVSTELGSQRGGLAERVDGAGVCRRTHTRLVAAEGAVVVCYYIQCVRWVAEYHCSRAARDCSR